MQDLRTLIPFELTRVDALRRHRRAAAARDPRRARLMVDAGRGRELAGVEGF